MTTRRQFLVGCSAIAVTASLAPTSTLSAMPLPREMSLDEISFEAFAGQLRTLFVAHDAAGVASELQLIQVQPQRSLTQGPAHAPDAQNEKFSLVFRGSPSQPLGQNTYWLEHRGLGRFALFMAPCPHQDPRHRYYEAIFNRPPRPACSTHI